jgi:flavin reductase (DIM6/NTAB) family NADH-FMN oxidoreductase RutF
LPSTPAGTDEFRAMMRGFPTGVSVVTAMDSAGRPRGMTCSSLCSVTLQPPTLLVCLRAGSWTLTAVRDVGTFAVNLLHEDALITAELFGSGDPDRFDRVDWRQDAIMAGPHLVRDAHAVADCRVVESEPVGDHVVVFGEVIRVTRTEERRPLLHGFRRYSRWPD